MEPPLPKVKADKDGDGIADEDDKCPKVAGLSKYAGCPVPDTDGDGTNDELDKCPTVVGVAKYFGCSVPDTDADGIDNEEDKCPTIIGYARNQGCPDMDTDGDGVVDDNDNCPNESGPTSNKGCPINLQAKIDTSATRIYFATNSATILKTSFGALNEAVNILKDNPSAKLDIEGHTDNTGSAAINSKLSATRAAAVKQYFVKQGIAAARLASKGLGSSKPRATNNTATGRAQNRRTTLRLIF